MAPHPLIKLAHFISLGGNALGVGVEMTRVVQEALYLTKPDQYDANNREDCPHFLVGSDLPPSATGQATNIMWHLLNAIFLMVCLLGDIPGEYVAKQIFDWNHINGLMIGTWHMGVGQIWVGSAILRTSIGPYGSRSVMLFRFLGGYMLMAVGLVNLYQGLIAWLYGKYAYFAAEAGLSTSSALVERSKQRYIRAHLHLLDRSRSKSSQDYGEDVRGENLWRNVGKNYWLIDVALQQASFHGETGKLMDAKDDLRKAIKAGGGL